jgi:hypothetical protein
MGSGCMAGTILPAAATTGIKLAERRVELGVRFGARPSLGLWAMTLAQVVSAVPARSSDPVPVKPSGPARFQKPSPPQTWTGRQTTQNPTPKRPAVPRLKTGPPSSVDQFIAELGDEQPLASANNALGARIRWLRRLIRDRSKRLPGLQSDQVLSHAPPMTLQSRCPHKANASAACRASARVKWR